MQEVGAGGDNERAPGQVMSLSVHTLGILFF